MPFALANVRPVASVIGCTAPPLPLIIELETSIIMFAASGRFTYWRDNVHNLNYARMRDSHPHRQVCLCAGGKVHANCPYICTSAIHTPLSTPETGDCTNEKASAAA